MSDRSATVRAGRAAASQAASPAVSSAVSPAGAPRTSPPATSRQLPLALPGFTGRSAQLAQLDHLLGSTQAGSTQASSTQASSTQAGPAARVAVISGTAGVGKTTVALHWAHRMAGRFPDGQLYLNLRGFDPADSPVTPEQAVRTLLDALGVPARRVPAYPEAQAALYRGLLAQRESLLILDNARDADQVRPLLPGGPACRVLVTSRNQLAGLMVTDGAHPVILDLLTDSEARQLLAARLGTAGLTAETEAVDDIIAACARLPLALAIVAARAVIHPEFPLAELAAELSTVLSTVHGGLDAFASGDPLADIRAVLSWSYRTLSPETARLFRLLAAAPRAGHQPTGRRQPGRRPAGPGAVAAHRADPGQPAARAGARPVRQPRPAPRVRHRAGPHRGQSGRPGSGHPPACSTTTCVPHTPRTCAWIRIATRSRCRRPAQR